MLVAVSVLAISLSILIYHYPPSTWQTLFAPATEVGTKSATPEKTTDKQKDATYDEQAVKKIEHPSNGTVVSPQDSPQSTPKATPQDTTNAPAVPTFTLDAHHDSSDDEDDNLPPPSFPAMNSAQRASAPVPSFSMAPPSKPTMAPPSRPATSSLMPPPRVAASNLRALPNTSSQSMRIPTTGPLPNRGPVPNRGPPSSNGSLGLAPTAQVRTPNARGKILLSPGHSPLDWANLQKSGSNLSGVNTLLRVTPAMLKEKNGRKGKPAWSTYQGKVYNISPYLPFHPGGEGELRRAAGKDGTKLFMEVHPWVNWENMLGECMVGIMVAEEQIPTQSSLEDMD